jgi:hypothetical protein
MSLTPLTAADLVARLRTRYAPPSYAFFTEVGDDPQRSRSADGLAIGMWRSRGLEILGFEVKVSRTDWLKELKTPQKADRIGRFCDRWYLVVSDAALVKDGELPTAWGLLVPKGDGLHEKVKAPKLEARMELSRPMLAAICRAIHKVDPSNVAMQAEYVRGRQEMRLQMEEQHERDLKNRRYSDTQSIESLQATIKAFEDASGVRLGAHQYEAGRIGEAVRLVLSVTRSGSLGTVLSHMTQSARDITQLVSTLETLATQAGVIEAAPPTNGSGASGHAPVTETLVDADDGGPL